MLEEARCPLLTARAGLGLLDAKRVRSAAALCCDLVLLRRLHGELGVALGGEVVAAAPEGGCEAVVEWLVAAGCEIGGACGEREVKQ